MAHSCQLQSSPRSVPHFLRAYDGKRRIGGGRGEAAMACDALLMTGRVVYRSKRCVRTVWMLVGAMYWVTCAGIAVGVAMLAPVWVSPVLAAAAGAFVVPLIWIYLGSHRMRMLIDDTELVARGWLWRSDILIRRSAVRRFQVVDFFDPRIHSLLWIRGGPLPVKLEAELLSGDCVGLASSFGPRRVVMRQAQELNAWVDSVSNRESVDNEEPGYALDLMPFWVEKTPWYGVAALIGLIAVVLTVALHFVPGTSEGMVRWVAGSVSVVAGAVASFGRLARRLPPDDSDEYLAGDHLL